MSPEKFTPPARLLPWSATLIVMVGLFLVSSIPGVMPEQPTLVNEVFSWFPPTVHNILHIPAYAVLAWTLFFCLHPHTGARLGPALIILAAGGYGALMELYQSSVPGRYPSLTDVALNFTGAVLGMWLAARFVARKRKN
jgi:hypothetical protein